MMRTSYRHLLLIVWMVLCSTGFGVAQEVDAFDSSTYYHESTVTQESVVKTTANPVTYNEANPSLAQWERITADKKFGYQNEREFTPTPQPAPVNKQTPLLFSALISFINFLSSGAGKLLLLSLLVVLIGYIGYRIVSGDGRIFSRRNTKVKEIPDDDAVISEEDLFLSNWEERLTTAIASGDTRMAIRYSYMLLLQILQARNMIQFRNDKTNTDYYRELSDTAVRQQFRQLSRSYEYAWYGNFVPSADAFNDYLKIFNGVKKELGAS